MDITKLLEFKNEVNESDKDKDYIKGIIKAYECAKENTSFEDYKAKLNEDKEGMFIYGQGSPKYTTLDYFLDVEVYDFLNQLGAGVGNQIHQVDEGKDLNFDQYLKELGHDGPKFKKLDDFKYKKYKEYYNKSKEVIDFEQTYLEDMEREITKIKI